MIPIVEFPELELMEAMDAQFQKGRIALIATSRAGSSKFRPS
jgi:hypothetical protein